MKFSESWLREWVNPAFTRDELCEKLTMSGLEVEEVIPTLSNDYTIDLSITPNRGDCLSLKGISREIAALTSTKLHSVNIPKVKATCQDSLPISIKAEAACPRYVGRVIRGINTSTKSPDWLKEKLDSCGIKSISPIVDVTNYVMLELGQPMHAFDLNTIQHEIKVRQSKQGEKILLLDGSEKELDHQTLIIADKIKPLAIAGVMGGMDSSVTEITTDVFLESAYFDPKTVAKSRQYYQLTSDSAFRFERGIDSAIQRDAIERATKLIIEITGGAAGSVLESVSKKYLPKPKSIALSLEKITRLLGMSVPAKKVETILKSLGMSCKKNKLGWVVKAPTYRPDITIAEDLIEEIARLYGYDQIPVTDLKSTLKANAFNVHADLDQSIKMALSNIGFHEIISYSFIDKKWQQMFDPHHSPEAVLNPITAEMDVMRTNLWPGLINTLLYNKSRQQHLVRLFEIGTCFIKTNNQLSQPEKLAGLVSGLSLPEQWGNPSRQVDFFDLKGSLTCLFDSMGIKEHIDYREATHSALHPGQSADIYVEDQKIGTIGGLHPTLLQKLDLDSKVFVFELDLAAIKQHKAYHLQEISKFPEIRRDIAILVNATVPAKEIQDTIRVSAGDWLKDVFIFDVYQGKGILPGLKSIALSLLLQERSRTLKDDEVAALMERVVKALQGQFGAELRS